MGKTVMAEMLAGALTCLRDMLLGTIAIITITSTPYGQEIPGKAWALIVPLVLVAILFDTFRTFFALAAGRKNP